MRFTTLKFTVFICCIFCFAFIAKSQETSYKVLFDFNKTELPDTAMLGIMKIIAANTMDSVIIQGHCDSIGSKQYNYALSERRAKAVKKLLTDNGIAASLIRTCIGLGEDQPLTNNQTEEDRQVNRRVTVQFRVKQNVPKPAPKQIKKIVASDLKAGKKLVLQGMQFQGGRHELLAQSIPILENLCAVLKNNPEVRLEIQGHVCCTTKESDGFDFDTRTNNLSENRAKAIYDYLVEDCHIAKSRLRHRGFGGSQKIYPEEKTEEEMQANRRVELKVINE